MFGNRSSSKEHRFLDGQVSILRELNPFNSSDSPSRPFRSLRRKQEGWSSGSNSGPSYTEKSHLLGAISFGESPHWGRSHRSSTSSRDIGYQTPVVSLSATMNAERGRNRRERTFVGSECAVCEEPLEHTLRGERILQFSCSHVSHEACFYQFIKDADSEYCPSCNAPLHLDTSRGGNVLDFDKIKKMVLSSSTSDNRSIAAPTPGPWETQPGRPASGESNPRSLPSNSGRESVARGNVRDEAGSRGHIRSDSDAPGFASPGGYSSAARSGPSPLHQDYEWQPVETTPASPQIMPRNPIPAPSVVVRSEYPSINRSRLQQTLTCLVTVEVADNKWQPDPEDIGLVHPVPQMQQVEEVLAPPKPPSPPRTAQPRFYPYEAPEVLEEMTENLRGRVDNWHGLDFNRFGKLRLYGTLRVGKDKISWQELECFLFAEMLICVKEKRIQLNAQQGDENGVSRKITRCTLKGSILIKKHLKEVSETGMVDENVLTLSLSVAELPQFHLRFENRNQLKLWQQALLDLNAVEISPVRSPEFERDRVETSGADGEDWARVIHPQRTSSLASSWGGPKPVTIEPSEYTNVARHSFSSLHVPIDVVVVVPISSSMQGVKISIVRDALKFMINSLGERDRMGLVTFGSGGGGVALVGMTTKAWQGWNNLLSSIKPVGQKSHRSDVVEGANVAMDLLMQRKYNNPIATIMLISDASTSDVDSPDFVISRAEAAKITIHSFGLGMTHKPDTMIELSSRTKASYTYVKDWMMLRECLAGCLGSMQSLSHQNVKLKLKLPEGSPARFHKISGALQVTKRATGRDAEASLGDLRFGDKRDILVQLVIVPDTSTPEQLPQDPWETIVSGLEALGGPLELEDQRALSIEEVPLVQADLVWGDILRDGTMMHLPRPSLLAITILPTPSNPRKASWVNNPPIPPHPHIVQRRMELLTSDMLTRALTLVTRGQHDRANTLLTETRTILNGLGKGGLPPVPAGPTPPLPGKQSNSSTPQPGPEGSPAPTPTPERKHTPSPTTSVNSSGGTAGPVPPAPHRRSSDGLTLSNSVAVDAVTVSALDTELESSLEWIIHPAVFSRDSRKALLQAIGVISSQRAFTFRTPVESLWASRVSGVRRLTERSREWREEGGAGGEGIIEES